MLKDATAQLYENLQSFVTTNIITGGTYTVYDLRIQHI